MDSPGFLGECMRIDEGCGCSSCYLCKTVNSSCNLVVSFRIIHSDALKDTIEFAGGDFMRHLSVVWDKFFDVEGRF